MVEKSPGFTLLAHVTLILGVALIAFPLYVTLIASTHALPTLLQGRMPLTPGPQAWANYSTVLGQGMSLAGAPPVSLMLLNTLVVALGSAPMGAMADNPTVTGKRTADAEYGQNSERR